MSLDPSTGTCSLSPLQLARAIPVGKRPVVSVRSLVVLQ
jgi:hypothetical protein